MKRLRDVIDYFSEVDSLLQRGRSLGLAPAMMLDELVSRCQVVYGATAALDSGAAPPQTGRTLNRVGQLGACRMRAQVSARDFQSYAEVADAYQVQVGTVLTTLSFERYAPCCKEHMPLQERFEQLRRGFKAGTKQRRTIPEAIQSAYQLGVWWAKAPGWGVGADPEEKEGA